MSKIKIIQRLKDAVIESAKARREAEKLFDANPSTAPALMNAEIAEDAAIDELIAFEAKNKVNPNG